MTHYELYVTDEHGRSSSWESHTDGHRGKRCLSFADDVNQTIVLHHPSMTTYIYISASGMLDIHTELPKPKPPVKTPVAIDTRSRRRRQKRPRGKRS